MLSTCVKQHIALKKVMSVAVLSIFFTSFILADARAVVDMGEAPYKMPAPEVERFAHLDTDTFTIPAHLGEVKYTFKGASDKLVVHLQDAHCNQFAQHKISGIIDYINKEYGIRMINLEGGVGDYDLTIFTSITGEAIRREVADYFVKKGEINGAEFYAINNPDKVVLWGVEDKDLYLANLKIYRDSLTYKEEVDEYLKQLTHVLNNLKRHIYTPELLKIDMAYNAYKEGDMDFREYLEFLIVRAKEEGVQVRQFSNLYLLEQAMELEDKIDFKKANKERTVLVDELKKGLSKDEIRELIAKSVDFKTKRISRKTFYDYLLSKAGETGLDIDRFPALSNYIVYVSLYEAVDRAKVMEELDELESKIKEPLYQNDTQRRLNVLSRNLALMKNIFAITLTKTDYQYYLKNRSSFDVNNYLEFIRKEAPKYRISAKLSANISKLDDYRRDISRFYEYSFRRDEIFLKNLRFGRTRTTENAILMTGGFHTENLCELLRKKDISYVSILPKFTSEKDYESPYFDLLAGQTTNLQRMLSSVIAKAAMMQIASRLSPALGDAVWGKANIDAFRAAVLIREQIAKGRDITNITSKGDNVVFHMKDGSSESMPVRVLLDAVHQREIDGQMERLAEESFEDIEDIETVLDRLKGFLKSIGAGDKTLSYVDDLAKRKNIKGESLVRLVRGVTFRGHAGGRGIRVNSELKGNELRAVILHEIIAGLFGDHFLAKEGEEAFLEFLENGKPPVKKILAKAPALPKPVWDMTPEERLMVDRDFAMAGTPRKMPTKAQIEEAAKAIIGVFRAKGISYDDIVNTQEALEKGWAIRAGDVRSNVIAIVDGALKDNKETYMMFALSRANYEALFKKMLEMMPKKAAPAAAPAKPAGEIDITENIISGTDQLKIGDRIVSQTGTERIIESIGDSDITFRVKKGGVVSRASMSMDRVIGGIKGGAAVVYRLPEPVPAERVAPAEILAREAEQRAKDFKLDVKKYLDMDLYGLHDLVLTKTGEKFNIYVAISPRSGQSYEEAAREHDELVRHLMINALVAHDYGIRKNDKLRLTSVRGNVREQVYLGVGKEGIWVETPGGMARYYFDALKALERVEEAPAAGVEVIPEIVYATVLEPAERRVILAMVQAGTSASTEMPDPMAEAVNILLFEEKAPGISAREVKQYLDLQKDPGRFNDLLEKLRKRAVGEIKQYADRAGGKFKTFFEGFFGRERTSAMNQLKLKQGAIAEIAGATVDDDAVRVIIDKLMARHASKYRGTEDGARGAYNMQLKGAKEIAYTMPREDIQSLAAIPGIPADVFADQRIELALEIKEYLDSEKKVSTHEDHKLFTDEERRLIVAMVRVTDTMGGRISTSDAMNRALGTFFAKEAPHVTPDIAKTYIAKRDANIGEFRESRALLRKALTDESNDGIREQRNEQTSILEQRLNQDILRQKGFVLQSMADGVPEYIVKRLEMIEETIPDAIQKDPDKEKGGEYGDAAFVYDEVAVFLQSFLDSFAGRGITPAIVDHLQNRIKIARAREKEARGKISRETSTTGSRDLPALKYPGTEAPEGFKWEDLGRMVLEGRQKGTVKTAESDGGVKSAVDRADRLLRQMAGLEEARGRIDRDAEIKSVEIVTADLADESEALSYVEEDGTLVIILNGNEGRSDDYFADSEVLAHMIRHEFVEASRDRFNMTHRDIKELEMVENKEGGALTVLNKLVLKHMTVEQLENIKPEHDLDPGSKFYNAVQTELISRLCKGLLDRGRPGKYPSVIIIQLPEGQWIYDGSKYVKLSKDADRTIVRKYGINLHVVYCVDTKEAVREAVKKVEEMDGLKDPQSRVVAFADRGGPYERLKRALNNLRAQNKLAGVVEGDFKPATDTERFSIVKLAILGVGLAEWHRAKDAPRAAEVADGIKELFVGIVDNPEAVEKYIATECGDDINLFIQNLLNGLFFMRIKKIDYEEIRDYMDAEATVLEAL